VGVERRVKERGEVGVEVEREEVRVEVENVAQLDYTEKCIPDGMVEDM
jgi:hypothetical protein